MKRRWAWALAVMAVVMALALPADAKSSIPRDEVSQRLARKGATGHIDVRAGRKHFPEGAEVSIERARPDDVKRKIHQGWSKRNGRARAPRAPQDASPTVLASYDISIRHGGKKWQPDAGDPVHVTVDLDEPVAITATSSLGIAHLSDDGAVEELPASRYGFTYNADKTAVTSFWVDADGFSIYTIIDTDGKTQTARRFYHFYGHSTTNSAGMDIALPYQYFDQSNDVVNVQIVKDGDALKEPPIPPDILDEEGRVVSMFEGWYIVSTNERPANAVESKLDSTNEYFQFHWPLGVTDQRLSFTNVVSVAETNDWDYHVVPLYENARFLQFDENAVDEQGGGVRIIVRKLVAINDETGEATLRVSDVSAALKNSRNEYFSGWQYYDTNGQLTNLLVYSSAGHPQEQFITVNDALFEANGGTVIPLYPLYVSAHFLNFDTNAKGSGATYVGSIFVRQTSNFSSVTPSGNRPGYEFAGWCAGTISEGGKVKLGERVSDANGNFIPNVTVTNASGNVIFYTDPSGNIRLNEDVTLFASWEAKANAPYRVIVWQQRVTDAKDAVETNKTYYYAAHYTSPAVPSTTQVSEALFTNFTGTRADGESITAKNLSTLFGPADNNVAKKDFTGFHYSRFTCEDATVAPDGSTVINLYYNRDLITLQFCVYQNQAQTVYLVTSGTSGTIYGTDDGVNYFDVYYSNGLWYKTRENGYDYYGKRYNRGNNTTSYYFADSYSGDYYTKSTYGNTYTRVTNGNYSNSTQYYGTENGEYFPIYRSANNGTWYKVQSETVIYAYSDPYTGTRYTRSTTNWVADAAHTFTGLYGQTLAFNGYAWPYSDYWYDGHGTTAGSGTRTTFLDAFKEDLVFYRANAVASDNKPIYFYKQTVNGDYEDGEDGRPNNFANTVNVGGNSGFRITDKYSGFKAAQYKADNGSWKNTTVSSSSSAITEYDSASFNNQLKIRFARENFELIYKDGDTTVSRGVITVPYEAPLTSYDFAVTNSLLNWGARDTTAGTFEGWYEDASLTVPFDFSGTMPLGTKFLYAKWAPLKHKVIIDPNGGEMQSGDSTWFYLDEGEKVIEYTVTRNYRLDMHNGTYYYHHDLWDPVLDKHTDQYDPATSNAPRRAYYTENASEATSNAVTNPDNRYSFEPNAYSFMGWFEVHEDGTLATDPFNFVDPPNRPITIRAIWRRMGVYTLKYESIDPDGVQDTEIIYDPPPAANGNFEDGYIDDAMTTLAKIPSNYDKDKWIWEGWQAVDTYNNNIPLTTIRSPGDTYIVKDDHADLQNVIHFRAVYKRIDDTSSRHIPSVTDLILDSNENAGLAADATITTEAGRIGTYTGGSAGSVSGLNQGVWFAGQQNNLSVNLADYTKDFEHVDGYFLLGWDPLRNANSMIPAHYANETIGIDKTSNNENILYAVWEPQIYIDFINDTGADLQGVQLYIPGWAEGDIFRVNSMHDTYRRSVFTAFQNGQATFDIPAGEHICLVLPDGADKDFTVGGTCDYTEGTKLVVSRIQPQAEGQEAIPDVTQSVYPGDTYMIAGTMRVDPEPVQVRFTKDTYLTTTTVPVRYFLHDRDGTVTEITQYNAAYWQSQNYQTSLTVGAATNDIATMLRTDNSSLGVHDLLSDNVRTNYGHTTIGIGSASAVITTDHDTLHANEYRSITQEGTSGGPYFRFYHEELDWSRYAQIWNGYDDPAIYVVFYKRTPVHVTVGKNVVGSEEDKSRTFDFTAQVTPHSTNLEYTVVTTYQQTRTLSATTSSSSKPNSNQWNNPPWNDPRAVSTNTSSATVSSDQTPDLFESRPPEQFRLADSARHPITIYYDSSETKVGEPVKSNEQVTDGQDSYTTSGSMWNRKYNHTMVQTKTWTQTVTYRVTYQYEVATVQETAYDGFTLTGIGGGGDSCKGTRDFSTRTYTISSLSAPDAKGFFTYQSLDTAIFTNTRNTGSVTVTKTVEGGLESDAGDTFTFTVTLGETVVGKDTYTPPAGVNLGPYGKVFTFTLGHGNSMTLPCLPAGASYTVAEIAHNKYVATVPNNTSGTIVEAGTTVAYVNTRKTDLSIAINDRTEYFTGDELQGWDISNVTGTGETISTDAYTVTGLKNGHVLTVEHYVAARGTAVGSYTGRVENAVFTVRDANDEDVTQQYVITATPGALTIEGTPIIVTVTGNHETKVYNGTVQECSGYTYEIKHALTDDPIVNDNIHVAINSEFQTAKRKDVGRSEMYLEPIRVIVTPPEGISVSSINVAANGYIEITPAQVTVTANDASKLPGAIEPSYTATVEGVFGEDTVTYTVSRTESGEAVGEYAIMPSGEASQGNYTVTYAGGKLTIANPSLTQRSTGSGIMVEGVSFTPEFLASSDLPRDSTPDSINEIMNAVDENGLMRWENLRLGLATNQVPLGTETGTSDSTVSVGMPPSTGKMADWGYDVLYELRKRNESDSSWSRVAGPVSSSGSDKLGIELVDAQGNSTKPTGLYRLVTLIVPRSNLSVTNEIPATNIIGVLEVESSVTNTITAVPWKRLASDPAKAVDITVSNYVAGVNLSAGDVVYKLDADARYYTMWTRGADGIWGSVTTVASATDGNGTVVSPAPEADVAPLQRGNAAWVKRTDTTKPYFLVGQYDEAEITVEVPGKTAAGAGLALIAIPTFKPLYLNKPKNDDGTQAYIDWSKFPVDAADQIRVPVNGVQTSLTYQNGKWGYYVTTTTYNEKRKKNVISSTFTPYTGIIPAGTGFFYFRMASEGFTFRWK